MLNHALDEANSITELCNSLTNALESEDDRYDFKNFTRYYGYSGFR